MQIALRDDVAGCRLSFVMCDAGAACRLSFVMLGLAADYP